MTGQQAIDAAGRLIGELRSGRSFNSLESADLLVSLNQMISAWSEDGVGIHQITREPLTSTGAASYTFGSGGSLNSARPIRIESARVVSSDSIAHSARIVTAEEWAAEADDDTATSNWAEVIHPDYGSPLCTIRAFPKVASGSIFEFFSLKPLTAIASLATSIAFPDGYAEALVSNFAVKIAPEFGKSATPELLATAERTRKGIADRNAQLYKAAE